MSGWKKGKMQRRGNLRIIGAKWNFGNKFLEFKCQECIERNILKEVRLVDHQLPKLS
jgi:hypothetical protein